MLTCFDVADYFLAHCDEESGDIISNLKIQKLTYYAQGFSLWFFWVSRYLMRKLKPGCMGQ